MVAKADPRVLAGRRFLIVEDEMLLAMDLEMLLKDQGCLVLKPVNSVQRALDAIDAECPDAATLDMNLNGSSSAPVATALQARNIPFVAVTGYTGTFDDDRAFQDVPVVKKPYDTRELLQTLARLLT